MKTACRVLLFFFLALWTAALLCGQGITGDLSVSVTDPNGASVANATLLLRNVQENTTIPGHTDDAGAHVFNELKPGLYSLEIKADGFQSTRLNDITIQLAQRAAVGVKLTLGQITETVNVSAAAETLLNSESATQGQVLQAQTIESLPLNGRNFIQLAQLSAGVTRSGRGTRRRQPGRGEATRRFRSRVYARAIRVSW